MQDYVLVYTPPLLGATSGLLATFFSRLVSPELAPQPGVACPFG